MNPVELEIQWLGRVPYAKALRRQNAILESKLAEPEAPDTLLLLEHDPVYTMGRSPDRASLAVVPELPYPLYETNRGGQATYHGPGQLVGYPIIDLRRRTQDLHCYLRLLESAIIDVLADFGLQGLRREGLTGVWLEDRKVASIGVGVRRWITMHGFALNVSNDLDPFRWIIPCGLQGVKVTSLERELGRDLELEEVGSRFSKHFIAGLGRLLPPRHASSPGLA